MEQDPREWLEYERNGNIGARIMLNPPLFSELTAELANIPGTNLRIADVGAGTGSLSMEFLHASPDQSEAVQSCWENMRNIRGRIWEICNVEKQIVYMDQGKCMNKDSRISFIEGSADQLPLDSNSLDTVISRQMLMHLSIEELHAHMSEVKRVLQKGRAYIFTVLNPEVEGLKHMVANPGHNPLQSGELYNYPHGSVAMYKKGGPKGMMRQFVSQSLGISSSDTPSNHFLKQYYHGIGGYFNALKKSGLQFEEMRFLHASVSGWEKTHKRYYPPSWANSLLFRARKTSN